MKKSKKADWELVKNNQGKKTFLIFRKKPAKEMLKDNSSDGSNSASEKTIIWPSKGSIKQVRQLTEEEVQNSLEAIKNSRGMNPPITPRISSDIWDKHFGHTTGPKQVKRLSEALEEDTTAPIKPKS